MKIEIIDYNDNWAKIKRATMNTISKDKEGLKYPSSEWKSRILRSNHSPIRNLTITVKFTDLPSWVSVHLVRHKIGIEHFVSTRRTDRTGIDRNGLRQDEPVDHIIVLNAQAILNISKVRLCFQASPETRDAWMSFIMKLWEVEPELAKLCVPTCIHCGYCPEYTCCGFTDSDKYSKDLNTYRDYKGEE